MNRTIIFENKPFIKGVSSVGGPKESSGCLGKYIEIKLKNDLFGESTFEKAETKILYTAIINCINNAGLNKEEVDCLFAGDLLNQIISATFSARDIELGFLGLYSACATFTEALILGASFINCGKMKNVVCATSSHFSSAERQYRYPLELGSTRPPQSQWTVTGSGACLLSTNGEGIRLVKGTIGRVVDFGVTDVNNMGAAMAPAAADTIVSHFINTQSSPKEYDLIVTGDLGALGSRLVKDLVKEKGFDINDNHVDCGELVFNLKEDEYQGGSGAGCISMVFCSYLYKKFFNSKIKKILLVATGALLSTTSSFQGESIPAIAHAVEVEKCF